MDNFVITSQRRLEKMGLISSLRYYFELELSTRYPNLKDILTYTNYVECRSNEEKLREAFINLSTHANNSAELTDTMKEYIQKKANKFTEELRQQFNETTAWAKKQMNKL